MKLIHVIDSLGVGGAEKMCIQLSTLFAQRNHSLSILYFRDTVDSLLNSVGPNIGIQQIDKKFWNPKFYQKVACLLNNYDVIHIHLTSALKIVYLADLFFTIKSKIVFHDHTGSKKIFYKSSNSFIFRRAISKYAYVAVHDELMQMTRAIISKNHKNMNVISNYVPLPESISLKVRSRTNEQNTIDLLIIGNIKDQKNQLFLVSIATELLKMGLKCNFHICGKIHDSIYHKLLLDAIIKNKLENSFYFYYNISEYWKIPLTVDLALMVSRDESGPLVNIEYILLGVPFLSHNVGFVSKLINAELPEAFIDNLDSKIWANRISQIFKIEFNFQLYKKIYLKYFSEENAYRSWCKIYGLSH